MTKYLQPKKNQFPIAVENRYGAEPTLVPHDRSARIGNNLAPARVLDHYSASRPEPDAFSVPPVASRFRALELLTSIRDNDDFANFGLLRELLADSSQPAQDKHAMALGQPVRTRLSSQTGTSPPFSSCKQAK